MTKIIKPKTFFFCSIRTFIWYLLKLVICSGFFTLFFLVLFVFSKPIQFFLLTVSLSTGITTILFFNIFVYIDLFRSPIKKLLISLRAFLLNSSFMLMSDLKDKNIPVNLKAGPSPIEMIHKETLQILERAFFLAADQLGILKEKALKLNFSVSEVDMLQNDILAKAMESGLHKNIDFTAFSADVAFYMTRPKATYGSLPQPHYIPYEPPTYVFQGLTNMVPGNIERVQLTSEGLKYFFDFIADLRFKAMGQAGPENYVQYMESFFKKIGEHNIAFFDLSFARMCDTFTKIIENLQKLSFFESNNVDRLWNYHMQEIGTGFKLSIEYLTNCRYFNIEPNAQYITTFNDFVALLFEKVTILDIPVLENLIPAFTYTPILSMFAVSMTLQSLFGYTDFLKVRPFVAVTVDLSTAFRKVIKLLQPVVSPVNLLPNVGEKITVMERAVLTVPENKFIVWAQNVTYNFISEFAYKYTLIYFPFMAPVIPVPSTFIFTVDNRTINDSATHNHNHNSLNTTNQNFSTQSTETNTVTKSTESRYSLKLLFDFFKSPFKFR